MTTRLPLFGSSARPGASPPAETEAPRLDGPWIAIAGSWSKAERFAESLVKALSDQGVSVDVIVARLSKEGLDVAGIADAPADLAAPLVAAGARRVSLLDVSTHEANDSVPKVLASVRASALTLLVGADLRSFVRPRLTVFVEGAPAAIRRLAEGAETGAIDLLLTEPRPGTAEALANLLSSSPPAP